jgi:tripartite-type tricarboxylate transporter receptor subunit TctC
MPGLASTHEQGLTDFDVPSWCAIFLPKGTPAGIVQKLHDATVVTMGALLIRERLKEIGCDLVPPERSSPEYLRKFVASEIDKWAAGSKRVGFRSIETKSEARSRAMSGSPDLRQHVGEGQ